MPKPQLAPSDARKIMLAKGIDSTKLPYSLLGIRGYFRDSMGAKNQNDRGIYDDALIQCFNDHCVNWQANTDPSIYREGVAVLQPGVWRLIPGRHNGTVSQYPAFRQFGKMTVLRDGGKSDTGYFGINNHRGGVNGTSSLGCQTVPVADWGQFKSGAYKALKVTDSDVNRNPDGIEGKDFPFVLVTREEAEKILGRPI